MFARATIFIAILSATVVALALLAQATRFSREALWVALLMIPVDLFIGVATFIRSVRINLDDARWVTGMNLLRKAYVKIAPEVEPYFVTTPTDAGLGRLSYGRQQRLANLADSLTTTSATIATLNSVLAGAIAGDIGALVGASTLVSVLIGAALSIVSGVLHLRYAARYRQRHNPASGS